MCCLCSNCCLLNILHNSPLAFRYGAYYYYNYYNIIYSFTSGFHYKSFVESIICHLPTVIIRVHYLDVSISIGMLLATDSEKVICCHTPSSQASIYIAIVAEKELHYLHKCHACMISV